LRPKLVQIQEMARANFAKVLLGLVIGTAMLASATAQDDWTYKNRTVTIFSAGTAGGGYDFYARLLARHLGRHLPGNPNVVV
jgi:tripartite-type tricarboxylate transporter receptor subunit TctC